jgi:hypothetical protein
MRIKMSKFEGGNKVRCADCVKLVDNKCSSKNVKVTPKKRRICASYEFQGEYQNRETADSIYIPHVSTKTKNLLKRLTKLGINPAGNFGETHSKQGGFHGKGVMSVPTTTATASARALDPVDQNQGWSQPTSSVNPNAEVWVPLDEEESYDAD